LAYSLHKVPTGSGGNGNINRCQNKEGNAREAVRRLHVNEIPHSIHKNFRKNAVNPEFRGK
jgi:hypothetical protein